MLGAVMLADSADAQQATVYVKKGNNNPIINGNSWATARPELADVLDPASPTYVKANDIVWVSSGTYLPDPTGTDRSRTFRIPHRVEVYGGFNSTEQVFDDRAGDFAGTILSGDLDGVPADRTTDSYHVVTVKVDTAADVNNVVLDGFTIQYGNADGTGSDDKGGGLLAFRESGNFSVRRLRVANCTFTNNRASFGGGMYAAGIRINGAVSPDEGLILSLCAFDSNEAHVVPANFASGGGLHLDDYEEVHVYSTVFRDNTADCGGGVWVGAPSLSASDEEDFYNCLFHDNEAIQGGGMFLRSEASGIHLRNCTLSQNLASFQGGGLFIERLSSSGVLHQLFNSIAWGNMPESIMGGTIGTWKDALKVKHSDVEGGWTGPGSASNSNIDADPLFEDPGMNIFKLGAGSPCIEVGKNDHIIADLADLDGDTDTAEVVPFDLRPLFPRKQDHDMNGVKIVDMGCYERTVGMSQ